MGGGWYGCHIASTLLNDGHDVKIKEASQTLLSGAGDKNQLRLHLGFHYLRSAETRRQSLLGFQKFKIEYPELSSSIERNIYAVPSARSVIDFETAKIILDGSGIPFQEIDNHEYEPILGMEGFLLSEERLVLPSRARRHFSDLLDGQVDFGEALESRDLELLRNDFDLVVDATYSSRLTRLPDALFEATLIAEFTVDQELGFGALTLVDGPFWSIYPTETHGLMSLSHVEFSVLAQSEDESEIDAFLAEPDESLIRTRLDQMAGHVLETIPTLASSFSSLKPRFLAKKVKTTQSSSDRSVFVHREGNLAAIRAGKIDAIFSAQKEIEKFIEDYQRK